MRVHPDRILCAVDFFDYSESIISYSEALSKEFGATLYLCHVVMDIIPLLGTSETALDPALLQQTHLNTARDELAALGERLSVPHELLVVKGDPAETIAEAARTHNINMVLCATHGQSGMKRFLIGSVTEKLMKTLPCPVLVLNTREHDFIPAGDYSLDLNKILVGCDFSDDSQLAFDYGLSLAQEFQAELHLAHVIKPADEMAPTADIGMTPGDYVNLRAHRFLNTGGARGDDTQIQSLRETLQRQLFNMVPAESRNWCTPTTVLLDGEPYEELDRYAREQAVDLIVLGIRGHTLLERLMVGSTTDRVIRKAPAPVLAVRQPVSG